MECGGSGYSCMHILQFLDKRSHSWYFDFEIYRRSVKPVFVQGKGNFFSSPANNFVATHILWREFSANEFVDADYLILLEKWTRFEKLVFWGWNFLSTFQRNEMNLFCLKNVLGRWKIKEVGKIFVRNWEKQLFLVRRFEARKCEENSRNYLAVTAALLSYYIHLIKIPKAEIDSICIEPVVWSNYAKLVVWEHEWHHVQLSRGIRFSCQFKGCLFVFGFSQDAFFFLNNFTNLCICENLNAFVPINTHLVHSYLDFFVDFQFSHQNTNNVNLDCKFGKNLLTFFYWWTFVWFASKNLLSSVLERFSTSCFFIMIICSVLFSHWFVC